MKKFFVLSAVLSVLMVFAGTCSAFTLAEHEDNVKAYAKSLARSTELQRTICEVDGSPVEDLLAMNEYDTVRYIRGEDDLLIELRPIGDIIQLVTRNPAFKLPNGSAVGDPIEDVLHLALVPGDYSREAVNGAVRHLWVRDGRVTAIWEVDARIAEIFFGNTSKAQGVTISEEYGKYLDAEGEAGSQQAAPVKAGLDYSAFYTQARLFAETAKNRLTVYDLNDKKIMSRPESKKPAQGELGSRRLMDAKTSFYAYFQGKDSVAVLEYAFSNHPDQPSSYSLAYYLTKDPKAAFPGGVQAGGEIAPALVSGLIPGTYSAEDTANGKIHQWIDEASDLATVITETGGKITGIALVYRYIYEDLKQELMQFLK